MRFNRLPAHYDYISGLDRTVRVWADKALDTAYLAALKKLLGKDADGEITDERKKAIEAVQKRLDGMKTN